MIKKIAYILLFGFQSIVLVAQQDDYQGVSIANDTLPPHPSTMLDIRSNSKGLLPPRIHYNDMIALPINNSDNSAQGLMFFVTSPEEKKGYYFYKNDREEWVRLQVKQQSYPMGAIVMYSGMINSNDFYDETEVYENTEPFIGQGKPGTQFEGWQICNGHGYSPDLRDRFIVMVSNENNEYKNYGESEYPGDDEDCDPTDKTCKTWTMNQKTMPKHKHLFPETLTNNGINYPHKHLITETEHTHQLIAEPGQGGSKHLEKPGSRVKKAQSLKNKSTDPTIYNSFVSMRKDAYGEEDNEDMPATIEFNGKVAKKGGNTEIDNCPPYFAVIFLMKTIYDEKEEEYKKADHPFHP